MGGSQIARSANRINGDQCHDNGVGALELRIIAQSRDHIVGAVAVYTGVATDKLLSKAGLQLFTCQICEGLVVVGVVPPQVTLSPTKSTRLSAAPLHDSSPR